MTHEMLVALLIATAVGGSLLLSLALTALVIPLARRSGFVDQPRGHKSHRAPVPYGGGVAILIGAWLPLTVAVSAGLAVAPDWLAGLLGDGVRPYLTGFQQRAGSAAAILAGGLVLHVLGLIDDVRALGPWPKLIAMLVVGIGVAWAAEVRILAAHVGAPLGILLAAAWITVIVNAFNFLDNMDGLSAGVATICLVFFAICGLLAGQVFIPLLAAVMAGALLGFLAFNFPPARIFMGDAGSLVVGYVLAIVSILTTYYVEPGRPPYALAMPLVVLAIPLYDFATVILIRLREGRSPLQGDQRHFSHRLVEHGLSRRFAVLTIYLATATTGLAATLLPGANLREMLSIVALVLMVLAVIAILESPPQRKA